jgi:hypothetical protein
MTRARIVDERRYQPISFYGDKICKRDEKKEARNGGQGRGKMYERKWKRNGTKTKGLNIGIKIFPPHQQKKVFPTPATCQSYSSCTF